MTSEPVRSIVTGKTSTPTTRTLSSGIDTGHTDQLFLLMRKPAPMPRNDPSSTKFEKYDRWTTFAPSHRISASSRKSMRQLDNSSRTTVLPASASAATCDAAPSAGEVEYARPGSTRSKVHPPLSAAEGQRPSRARNRKRKDQSGTASQAAGQCSGWPSKGGLMEVPCCGSWLAKGTRSPAKLPGEVARRFPA